MENENKLKSLIKGLTKGISLITNYVVYDTKRKTIISFLEKDDYEYLTYLNTNEDHLYLEL